MAEDTGRKTFVSSAIVGDQSTPAPNEKTTTIDDIDVTFVSPELNQIVLMTMLIENAQNSVAAGAALINIFFTLIKPDEIAIGLDGEEVDEDDEDAVVFTDYTSRQLQAKMMDPKDKFGIEVISDVMTWLLEEWSDRPTTPTSRSSTSQARRGSTSKATQRGQGSTRGRSRA